MNNLGGMREISDAEIRKSRILVLDQDRWNIELVERLLEWAGFSEIHSSFDLEHGAAFLRKVDPDLVIFDVHFAKIDGLKLLEELRSESSDGLFLPILVFTSDKCEATRQQALRLGANDFLNKPGDSTEIILRVSNFLRMRLLYQELHHQMENLEATVRQRVQEAERAHLETHRRLAFVAEYRDDDTGMHTYRVGDLTARIAEQLGWSGDELDNLRLAAQLHDIGKVGVPDFIFKKPDKLSIEEFELMKTHTTVGARILSGGKTAIMKLAQSIAETHHERWDGTGYPKGLSGTDIPISGRIVAVADVFDALTHKRVYKDAIPFSEAAKLVEQESGSHFDPEIVDAFLKFALKPAFMDEFAAAA